MKLILLIAALTLAGCSTLATDKDADKLVASPENGKTIKVYVTVEVIE